MEFYYVNYLTLNNIQMFIVFINLLLLFSHTKKYLTRLPGAVPQLIGLFLFCIEFGWG